MEKRHVAQIWWALHSIECILTSITGRPSIINPQVCTVALLSGSQPTTDGVTRPSSTQKTSKSSSATSYPFYSASESARTHVGRCLVAWTRLDVIQHKVLSGLYSVRTVGRPWESIQAQISSLMKELEEWAQESLVALDFHDSMALDSQARENVRLLFYYESARICVTRPCLCRLDRRLKGQLESSASPVQAAADACIQAALSIASGLPKNVSYRWLYEMGPWWSGIHMIMQAITVLLLELTQRSSSLSKDTFYIFACVENLVQWLKALKAVDRVAENAYGLVCDMLRKYKRFTKDAVPEQWLADETKLPDHHDANIFSEKSASVTDTMAKNHFMPQNNLFSFQTSHDVYGSGSERPLLSSNHLETAFDGGLHFGQTQYTPYHSSQFTTLFDQEMGDETDGNHDEEGWNPPLA